MFNFHKDHKKLVITAFVVFVALSCLVAVIPSYQMQSVQPLPNQPEMTDSQIKGLHVYVSENCMACHTQQVRNIEMDEIWGDRPSMPSDYYYSKQRLDIWRQSPSLLGSERTGPDLTDVGNRQPAQQWHLLHLYNPRIVVAESVMPGYSWLFKETSEPEENDIILPVPDEYLKNSGNKIVATQDAIDLVAYLQSLKQTPLPDNTTVEFIPSRKKEDKGNSTASDTGLPDGETLYMQNCAACHQQNGKGLPGAFPPLAGSSVVNDHDHELLIKIILQGYDARTEYGQMPGFAAQLTDEEIAAIVNHERSSWGNNAPAISTEDVKEIRDFVMQQIQ